MSIVGTERLTENFLKTGNVFVKVDQRKVLLR